MASPFKNPNGEKQASKKKVPYAAIAGLGIFAGAVVILVWKWDDINNYFNPVPSIGSPEAVEARQFAAAIKTSGQVPYQTSIKPNVSFQELQAQEQAFRQMSQQ